MKNFRKALPPTNTPLAIQQISATPEISHYQEGHWLAVWAEVQQSVAPTAQ